MKRKIEIIKRPIAVPSPVVARANARTTVDASLNLQRRVTLDEKKRDLKKINFSKTEPIVTFSISSPQDNTEFSNNNVNPYDALANVTVDKPEIIALTDFLPCYDKLGDGNTLNSIGTFFQAKQDANLISCVDSLKNIFETIKLQKQAEETTQITIKKTIETARQDLYTFCDTIESGLNSLMAGVTDTKRALNFKTDFSYTVTNLSVPEDLKNLATVDELTNTPREHWSNWTSTKTWLQMCLEFREALQMGVSSNDGLFVIESSDASPPTNVSSAYLLHEPQNRKNKLTFNKKQLSLFTFYSNTNNVLDLTSQEILDTLQSQLILSFTTEQHSILNVPMQDLIGEDVTQKSKSIARLSYLIAKELKYSSELRKLLYNESQLLTDLNYPTNNLNKEDNVIFWNYLIGKVGRDITDIPKNPYSFNSLTAIAQRREFLSNNTNNEIEVLSFENSYVNDDVQAADNVSRNAILTPGSIYYIDELFETKNLFQTSNINSFRDSVRIAANSVKDICSAQDANNTQFLFDKLITPRSKGDLVYTKPASSNDSPITFSGVATAQQELDSTQNSDSNFELSFKNINNIIRNPLQLIRFLENKLLTEDYLPRLSEPLNVKKSPDVSPLLISFALDNIDKVHKNNNLLALLYIYVIAKVDAILKINSGTQTNHKLKNITDKIKTYFIEHFANSRTVNGNFFQDNFIDLDQTIDSRQSMLTLDKIALVIASIVMQFNKQDSSNVSTSDVANPFTFGRELEKTFYTGIQKESLTCLMFFLCCLMVNEVNFQTITALINDRGKKFFVIQQTRPPVEKLEYFNNTDTIDLYSTQTTVGIGGVKQFNIYRYDEVILEAEYKIWSETVKLKKMSSWFACYLTLLDGKLTNLINQFQNNSNTYRQIYDPINDILRDGNLVARLFGIEQLDLLKSKLSYLKTRLNPNYDSGLKTLVPYFATLKNEDLKVLNNLLPLEDLHLASWNFLLKEYLKKDKFKAPAANNLKIISVGIPQKLYRRLRKPTNASTLKDTIGQKNIVSINVYLEDHLRPTLIHKPQKFIFDLQKYPIRTLNYYLDQAIGTLRLLGSREGEELENLSSSLIEFLPFFNLQNFQNISELRAENAADLMQSNNNEFVAYSNILGEEQIRQLGKNHIDSLFLEEYLKFSTGVSFDEQSFFNYENTVKSLDSSTLGVNAITNGAIEYLKNTMFLGEETIKRNLITPKKFDRVFHISFDPDDFEIDEDLSKYDGQDVIAYYKQLGIIEQTSNDKHKRVAARHARVEFNSYYAELEVIA